ncbi:MAG: thiamine ABC transporter substrate binding subunit [Acidimicrobiia bacterium]
MRRIPIPSLRSPAAAAATALALCAALAACGDDSTDDAPATLTLLTYDSFVPPASLTVFTEETGIEVEIAAAGDSGTLVNKAILTAGNPEGDVLWGLDNTLLSRAIAAEVFEPYESTELLALDHSLVDLVPGHEVTPVDTGDVCLNIDIDWFASRSLLPPATLDDLAKPELKGLTVVENPATSSPGLAFLLASVAHFGPDGFESFWSSLRDNEVLVVDSWDAAYYDEFTAGGGDGDRPIVVSYASSPPATIVFAEEPKPASPTTASVDATCFRQVEFAGVLRGSDEVAAARQLLDFLVGEEAQSELPLTNFVYPARTGVVLPEVFERFAKQVVDPLTLDPAEIDAHRDEWIESWNRAVLG